MWSLTLGVLSILIFALVVVRQVLPRSRKAFLPPGPRPSMIWGNLLDIPAVEPWKKFREWSQSYGPLVYVNLPTQPTIVINSAQTVFDLLDKRSQIYSDRLLTVMDELMSWDFSFAHLQYGQRWRDHRRTFHRYFNQGVVQDHRAVQLKQLRMMLGRIVRSPEHTAEHVHLAFVAIILEVVYGKKVNSLDDDYFRLVNKSMEGLSIQKVPGAFWVEYFPWLQYIPSWVPGTRFKRIAEHYKTFVESMINQPFDEVIVAEADGAAKASVARSLILQLQLQPGGRKGVSEQEQIARNVTGVAYGAAADTTTSAASSFLTAMVMFPEVQRKAQAELDSHVGPDRLPDWGDRDNLTYIRAVTLEAMRWMPVVPLGLPHRVMTDDEYKGYMIPKGTILISNTWSMLRNPEDYPEPEKFNPDRFIKEGQLNSDIRDPTTMSFGFGRRVCPGRHFSDASLFLYIDSILHVFEIHPGVDVDGKLQEITDEATTGLVSFPKTIPNGLKPRSAKAERLVRDASVEVAD